MRLRCPIRWANLALVLAGIARLGAQSPAPAESHQFDFWLGEWQVIRPDGQPAGTSRIESIAGGCGLLENWTGAAGGNGKSLNAWNSVRKQWQQFWIGNDGSVLETAGGLDAQGRMVLTGEHATSAGARVLERITWTPNPDGSIRQLWDQSTDAGQTWRVVFDGRYVRINRAKKVASADSGGGGNGIAERAPYSLLW